MKKVVTTGLVFLIVVFTLMLAGCGKTDPVDIVKSGELYDYPGKAIGEAFERATEEEDYTIFWEDRTSSETGSEILDGNDEYNSVVSTVISDGTDTLTFWWQVNTDDQTFELYGLVEGDEVYLPDDEAVTELFEEIFTY